MANTLRPKNVCNDCGDTWYPRGRNLSNKCPNCGSSNTRFSREGLVGVILMVGVVCFAVLSKEFKIPANEPAQVTESAQGSIKITAESGFEKADLEEALNPLQEEETVEPTAVEPQLNEVHESTPEESLIAANERRAVFHEWSESEKHLRDEYTKLLNDSNISASELDDRKREYLKFVDGKNQKCGHLTPKITSNINSDVSRVNFEESEIMSLKCHIEENSSAILQKTT